MRAHAPLIGLPELYAKASLQLKLCNSPLHLLLVKVSDCNSVPAGPKGPPGDPSSTLSREPFTLAPRTANAAYHLRTMCPPDRASRCVLVFLNSTLTTRGCRMWGVHPKDVINFSRIALSVLAEAIDSRSRPSSPFLRQKLCLSSVLLPTGGFDSVPLHPFVSSCRPAV